MGSAVGAAAALRLPATSERPRYSHHVERRVEIAWYLGHVERMKRRLCVAVLRERGTARCGPVRVGPE